MKDASTLLIELGVSPHLRGFGYIKTALEILEDSETRYANKIYACIGEKYKIPVGRIERDIRYAIERVDKIKYRALGGNGLRNYEFLYTLMYIQQKGAIEDAE